ncbi:hypothetical protein HAALTHF_03320n [Vreelandella aquamarina]|nr:hypothetical protein HAALTHF_03320n [Halomonas axialensis]
MGALKTFNVAGLTSACAVIPDATLRKHFAAATKGFLPDGNVLGLVAAEAAYREGEPWRQALLDVLRSHRAALEARGNVVWGVAERARIDLFGVARYA